MEAVGVLPPVGGQFMETVDWTEQMFGTIVLSVMVDADKNSMKTDEKQKKARET
jgi:hypothetical protein